MKSEPLIIPYSPGATLARLAQVRGQLQRREEVSQSLPQSTLSELQAASETLTRALESGEASAIQNGFSGAQSTLSGVYHSLGDGQHELLGFPTPQFESVAAVDVSTVLATYYKPERQILTTLCFDDAAGAIGYWLIEVRTLNDEKIEDHLIESYSPQFSRLRLPIGTHTFRIETRDNATINTSQPFSIEVPDL